MKAIADIQLVTPGEEVRPAAILIEGEMIQGITGPDEIPGDAEVILDGGGELLAFPGFIDIHTHGANGIDLSSGTLEAVNTIAKAKLAEGVTSFLPTTWTASVEMKEEMVRAAGEYKASGEPYARTPFVHIEGPYLNPEQAGAQDPKYMREPDAAEIRKLHAICPVGIVSIAVELPGALEFIREMKQLGIVTSVAHSAATYAEFQKAREEGTTHLTHYCNQMSRLHHREIGLVGGALLDDDVMIEVICDTVHLCPDMIELTFKHRSCDRLMLITDSIAASHLGDGTYPLGDTEIIVKDGQARIPAGNLAGSIALYNDLVRNVSRITNLPLPDIAKTASLNQARSLGLNDRGKLEAGQLADIALLKADFDVTATAIGGEIRYQGS